MKMYSEKQIRDVAKSYVEDKGLDYSKLSAQEKDRILNKSLRAIQNKPNLR